MTDPTKPGEGMPESVWFDPRDFGPDAGEFGPNVEFEPWPQGVEYIRADLYAGVEYRSQRHAAECEAAVAQAVAERDAAVARAERYRATLVAVAISICERLRDPERAERRRFLGIKTLDEPCGLCGPCIAAVALAADASAGTEGT